MALAMKIVLTIVCALGILGTTALIEEEREYHPFYLLVMAVLIFCIVGTWVWL